MPPLVSAAAPAVYLLLLYSCRAVFGLLPTPRPSLWYTTRMSLPCADNPFGEFALGVSPVSSPQRSAGVGGVRPAAGALSMTLETNDSKVTKKRRAPTDAAAAGQKKPKGLVEKYR